MTQPHFPTARRVAAAMSGLALAALAASCSTGSQAQASDYPSEDVRLIIPYAAGGPTDVTARALAPCLEQRLGEPVVPENIDGASGGLGMQELVAAEPDGHTLALASTGMVVLTPLVNDLDYSRQDVTPIGEVSRVPMNFVVTEESPYRSMEQVVAAARNSPGQLKVAVSGASTPQSIELRRLRDLYGVNLKVVPFDGSSGAIAAMLGGHVDAGFLNQADDVLGHIKKGNFRVLAVSAAERSPHLPDTPTLAELGFPKLTLAVTAYGLVGPAGMPEPVTSQLSNTLRACLNEPSVVNKIGARFVGEQYRGGTQLAATFRQGAAIYEEIVGRN